MNSSPFSIIIPAYNEEKWLPKTLENITSILKRQSLPGTVILVDNNSTDRTAKIAEEWGARVVFEKINQISRARNRGAKESQEKFLFFIDADTLISDRLLLSGLEKLNEGSVCGGGSTVSFDEAPSPFARRCLATWNWISTCLNLSAGGFFFCRRDAFEQTGGFNEKVYSGEEIWLSLNLKRWGRRRHQQFLIFKEFPVRTSSRKFEWYSPLELSLLIGLMVIFPWGTRFKRLNRIWYERPQR